MSAILLISGGFALTILICPETLKLLTWIEKLSNGTNAYQEISVRGRCLTIRNSNEKVMKIPLEIVTGASGIRFTRFRKNLFYLNEIGLIKIRYFGRKRIEIDITDEMIDFLSILRDCNIGELTLNHLKALLFLLISPFDNDMNSISSYIGLSLRGTRKVMNKLRSLNLVSSNIHLTEKGKKFLDYVFRPKYLKHLPMHLNTNPFFLMSLMPENISSTMVHKIIKSIVEQIQKLYRIENNAEFLDPDKLYLLGIDTTLYLSKLLSEIANVLGFDSIQVPLIYDKPLLYEFLHKVRLLTLHYLDAIFSRKKLDLCTLFGRNLSLLEHLLHELERVLQGNSLIIFAASHVLCYIINQLLFKSTEYNMSTIEVFPRNFPAPMINIFRIDESITVLKNDISRMVKEGRALYKNILGFLNEGGTIKLEWNQDTDYPSYIELKFRKINNKSVYKKAIVLESGALSDSSTILIPLGELRLMNFHFLIERKLLEINGEIYLLGEPILGLKHANEQWILEPTQYPEAIVSIKTIDRKIITELKYTKYKYLSHVIRPPTYPYAIHFGLNEIAKNLKLYHKSPIIMSRTKHFIHIIFAGNAMLDDKVLAPYHLFIKNATLYANEEKIWQTAK